MRPNSFERLQCQTLGIICTTSAVRSSRVDATLSYMHLFKAETCHIIQL